MMEQCRCRHREIRDAITGRQAGRERKGRQAGGYIKHSTTYCPFSRHFWHCRSLALYWGADPVRSPLFICDRLVTFAFESQFIPA